MHCTALLSILALCGSALGYPPYLQVDAKYGTKADNSTSSSGKRAVGFFGSWVPYHNSTYSPCHPNSTQDIYARNFFVTDISANQFTHISYAFAKINNVTGEVFLSDTWADIERPYPGDPTNGTSANLYGNIKQLYLLKKQNRSLKTLLSVGGWTYSPTWSSILHDETCRAKFASSAVKLMYNLGFDGLDYDYEYVNSTDQRDYFADLLSKTRTEMAKLTANSSSTSPFLLTMDVPAGPKNYQLLPFAAMNEHVDFINFMAFDYAGAWNLPDGRFYAGHTQNLYGSNDSYATPFNTSTGIDYYIHHGHISPSKINLGNPLYGHSFENTNGPGTPFNGTGNGSFGDTAGTWNYNELPINGSNVTLIELPDLGASYTYDNATRTMVSYDTPNIARQKAQYVIDQQLGGAMWWEISMDKEGSESLVSTTVETFGGLEKSQNRLDYPDSSYENLRNGFPGEG